jgi:mono/diheme cytochrome c family protein
MQTLLIRFFYFLNTHSKRWLVWAACALALLVVFLLLRSTTLMDTAYYSLWENAPDRSAQVISDDSFGDKYSKVVYLDQGWSPADSLWFYQTDQGADLMPYDMFLALEKRDSQELFRSDQNMNQYRYLPQRPTRSNPDGLPVGMTDDTYKGKKYMGFTCAACHTSQLNFNGVGIRIDGGPAAADMDLFLTDLAQALQATHDDPAKKQRFIDAVLRAGHYRDAAAVEKDLDLYVLRMETYNYINHSDVPYGYYRLDAFGRIYNRVSEHVLNADALRAVLAKQLPPDRLDTVFDQVRPVLSDRSRDHLIEKLAALLSPDQLKAVRDEIFNPPSAPVSYPFLWDIARHDYVQWNGIGINAGVGPIGRNTGEVIGVFATLDWKPRTHWSLRSLLGGRGFRVPYIRMSSSVNTHNLRRMEDRLWDLQSPSWQDAAAKAGLPPLKTDQVKRGEGIYDRTCARCHVRIDRASPDRRVVAQMIKSDKVGTDPTMADSSVKYTGYSGILRNQYVRTIEVGDIMLDTRAPMAALLTRATESVVATPSSPKWFLTRWADWAIDLLAAYFGNQIQPSLKTGDYTPDTTAAPYASLQAYKARPLNGIWATAPYLHNGSVPTLYDLLLPASAAPNDPPGTQYRPKTFYVGSREFDPVKVGFRTDANGPPAFLFDTTKPSNHNTGHDYCTRTLTEQDRWDLVEYLKSL